MLVSEIEKKPDTISSTISAMMIVPGENGSKRMQVVDDPMQYPSVGCERQVARCNTTSSTKRLPK
jgi:hypothetical protein